MDISERPRYYRGAGRTNGSYVRVGDADLPMTDYELYLCRIRYLTLLQLGPGNFFYNEKIGIIPLKEGNSNFFLFRQDYFQNNPNKLPDSRYGSR